MMPSSTAASSTDPGDAIDMPGAPVAKDSQSVATPSQSPRPHISVEQTPDEPATAPHLQFHSHSHDNGHGHGHSSSSSSSSSNSYPQHARANSTPPILPLSPLRHHKRTPSQHRQVKETLDAKYINDEIDGKSQYTVNQYVIGDEIGRGSYGAVHLATDQFRNEFAVKEFSKSRLRKRAQSNILRRPEPGTQHQLRPGMGPNNFHRKLFGRQEDAEAKDALYLIRAEIAIMKKLNHPNLVALIEVLDDPEDDSLYMVLEMCKKGVVMKIDLDQDADPYDNELCRTWFRDLILGIEYLHEQGIIHRDIKPDNLLLTDDDVLKIVDFGVSEMFEKPNEMKTSKSAGSPAFLPPELCQAKHGDISGTAADVWSMGVTLYCLKYGKLPFRGENVLDMYDAIRVKPLSLPDNEDPEFVDLITRILDKNNETRITLPEIREHPWVTRNGEDPLLPFAENCSDIVETPNELEVNHAFTRKMDHLICVLRAIRRFKGLISPSQVTTPYTPNAPTPLAKELKPEDPPSSSTQNLGTGGPSRQKSVAEEAAELIEQRKVYLQKVSVPLRSVGSEQDAKEEIHATDLHENNPLLLGIGAGGEDDVSLSQASDDIVSESPTGIDFDVYDRAFETEIKRIRSDRKKKRSWTYMTKLLGEKEKYKYIGDDCMIIEAGKSLATSASTHGSSAVSKAHSLIHDAQTHSHHGELSSSQGTGGEEGAQTVVGVAKETGSRLADLVASMAKDLRGKGTTQEQKH
ncbi:kinase-like domain-containing protein [Nemania sp. FL0916]|nr:kinase-like domain-containing protein [Nemania sp. FL0916]